VTGSPVTVEYQATVVKEVVTPSSSSRTVARRGSTRALWEA
jgi:hypothetical protein